jgi:hypothetical protein
VAMLGNVIATVRSSAANIMQPMAGLGRGCVKTFEVQFAQRIFSHVHPISCRLLSSNRALSHLRVIAFMFSHSLDREKTDCRIA